MKKSVFIIGIIIVISIVSCVSAGKPKGPVIILLDAPDATLSTDMDLVLEDDADRERPNVGWWSSLNDIISWDFKVTTGGTYNVLVNISCDTQFPGSLVGVTAGGQKLEFNVPDTISWEDYFDIEIGTFDLDPGSYTLEIQGIELVNRFFANIRYVKLVLM
jgi:hypothetical protein